MLWQHLELFFNLFFLKNCYWLQFVHEKYDLLMCFIGIVSAAKFNWHKKLVNSTVEVCIVYLLGKK